MSARTILRHRRRSTGCAGACCFEGDGGDPFKIVKTTEVAGSRSARRAHGDQFSRQRTGLIPIMPGKVNPKSGRVDADDLHRGHGF